MIIRCTTVLSALLLLSHPLRAADTFSDTFSGQPQKGWTLEGAVIDTQQGRGANPMSLRVAPNAKAVLKLRDTDGAGRVSLWVYDDMTAPQAPKTRRVGPTWGLIQNDGHVLTVGMLYAPYLSGATSLAMGDYQPPKENSLQRVQYLGVARKAGWHHWEFNMDPDKGLTLQCDSKPIKRFDWNKTAFNGFCGVVLFGDSKAAEAQTVWIDDVDVVLGPAMKSAPTPPPPPPPVVPDKDPVVSETPVKLSPSVQGQHPRLFFGPGDVAALRAKALSPAMETEWKDLLAFLPSCRPFDQAAFLKDATDGQRQGLWRMPTLSLHYLVTGDKQSLDNAVGFMKKLLDMPHWETGSEVDAGMSSANVLIGAAICYDWLYPDLDPAFREQFRAKLIAMARAQYYGGHLNKNNSMGYWQGDPANNHRWHRDAGLSLAALAAYEGNPEEQWILNRTAEELAFIAKWLPEDGTSHESPTYLTFGMPHLTLTLQAADHCLGTHYLDSPYAASVAGFKLQTITPGFNNGFQYGDSDGVGGYNHFVWKYIADHKQADLQAGFERLQANDSRAFQFGWMGILWKNPSLTGGSIAKLPTTTFYPDLGLCFMRDRWDKGGVAAMFKCGPFGGYTLNRYRNENNFKYINVAHDDPDANSFMLFAQDAFLAESDRYSKHKRSSNHNTILINGKGQMAKGRPENIGFTQPAAGNVDMTTMGVITGWKDAGDIVIVEGEAGDSYTGIDRFRRAFVWVKGGYILILDDIQAPGKVDITWLLQAPQLTPAGAASMEAGAVLRCELKNGGASCPVMVMADQPFGASVVESTADNRGQPLGWRQLQLKAQTGAWRVFSLYDPWARGDLTLNVVCQNPQSATITIKGKGISDTWQWTRATERFAPSSITGRAVLDAGSRPVGFTSRKP